MRDLRRAPPIRDLDTPEEIAEMVRRFYADVAQDDLLGPMFNDVAKVSWSDHLPKLTDFWCRVPLGLPGYAGNPFRAVHALVHEKRVFMCVVRALALPLPRDARISVGVVSSRASGRRARGQPRPGPQPAPDRRIGHSLHSMTTRPGRPPTARARLTAVWRQFDIGAVVEFLRRLTQHWSPPAPLA